MPQPSEAPQTADLVGRLRHAITTASNDDHSAPMTDKRLRHTERIATMEEAAGEIERLRQDVIAFCGPWAATYAREHGLPRNHLHPVHYDILARCGARMVDFIRGEEPNDAG